MISADELQKLAALSIVSTSRRTAPRPARRLGTARGNSLEFADFHRYNPGDDVRLIDWHLYARTRQPFIRRFQAESELDFHILLDTSQSMQFGDPPKLVHARAVAAALAYVGLNKLDRVGVATFSDQIMRFVPPRRGKRQLGRLLDLLHDPPPPGGGTDLQHVCKTYVSQVSKRGLVCIVSDFLPSTAYEKGLHHLLRHKVDIIAIQILAQEELCPQIKGDVVLHGLEHDMPYNIKVDQAVIDGYTYRLTAFITALTRFCRKYGITYVQLTTPLPFAEIVDHFLRSGVWQRR
jgi:uncharacterized protein (DUF58 family)